MFCITYDTTCYADLQRAFDSFMRQLHPAFGETSGSSRVRSRTRLANTAHRICDPIRTRTCREIGCRSIILNPKS